MLILPHNFTPRPYQLPTLKALDSGYKRIIQIWHRRCGKDKVDFNYIVKEAARVPGQYYYGAPNYEQGRKIIWDNIDNDGFKMLDHIPKEIRKRVDNTRMQIELINGSLIQVIGTDVVDRLVGTNPRIFVFTEYSIQNPAVLDYILPIVMANGGTLILNFTPRGKNHAHQLLKYAEKHPNEWYISKLSVDDTNILSAEALATEKERLFEKYKDNALFNQEYYISFESPVQGSYYGQWITDAEDEGRITTVPYDQNVPVNTYWDLGVGDYMAIWFVQYVGKEIHFIDYYETSGEGIIQCIKVLKEKPYVYGRHFGPHDIEAREITTAMTRRQTASEHGIEFEVAARLLVDEGIDIARRLFNQCYFDTVKTEKGVNALRSYQKVYDDRNETYRDQPLHNWASHGSDAFRTFAVCYDDFIDESGDVPDETHALEGFY